MMVRSGDDPADGGQLLRRAVNASGVAYGRPDVVGDLPGFLQRS
jgi:hypothetical protein